MQDRPVGVADAGNDPLVGEQILDPCRRPPRISPKRSAEAECVGAERGDPLHILRVAHHPHGQPFLGAGLW